MKFAATTGPLPASATVASESAVRCQRHHRCFPVTPTERLAVHITTANEQACAKTRTQSRLKLRAGRLSLPIKTFVHVHRRIICRSLARPNERRGQHEREIEKQQRQRHRGGVTNSAANAAEELNDVSLDELSLHVETQKRRADDEGGDELGAQWNVEDTGSPSSRVDVDDGFADGGDSVCGRSM